jgi:hypothetical protein
MTRHYAPEGMTTKEFYFNHIKGLSNSGMGKVQDWLDGKEDKAMPEAAFRFGSMVDAMLTQPDELEANATDEELLKAMQVRDAIRSHPLGGMLLDKAEPQVIITNTLKLDYEGIEFEIEGKCMLDGLIQKMKIGKDDKTTAARTHAQFMASVERFNYDRQAFWYMELAELDRFVFIGASKIKVGEVFIHIIKRGDPMWLSGKEKATSLAYYSKIWK